MHLPLLACLVAIAGSLAAADAPAPVTPSAPGLTVDPVTARRAGEAADAILKQEAEGRVRPDPEAENTLAEAEVLLLEAQTYLDQKQPLKAGETYVAACAKIQGIPVDQRKPLGRRLVAADRKLTELSRLLLGEPRLDPGPAEPPAAPPAAPGPAPSGH